MKKLIVIAAILSVFATGFLVTNAQNCSIVACKKCKGR
jgi:hypothetical protein